MIKAGLVPRKKSPASRHLLRSHWDHQTPCEHPLSRHNQWFNPLTPKQAILYSHLVIVPTQNTPISNANPPSPPNQTNPTTIRNRSKSPTIVKPQLPHLNSSQHLNTNMGCTSSKSDPKSYPQAYQTNYGGRSVQTCQPSGKNPKGTQQKQIQLTRSAPSERYETPEMTARRRDVSIPSFAIVENGLNGIS